MLCNNTQAIFKQIRHIMLDKDISITELSNRMQKSTQAVSNVFRQDNVSINMLLDICNALNIELDISFIDSTDSADSAGGREAERED